MICPIKFQFSNRGLDQKFSNLMKKIVNRIGHTDKCKMVTFKKWLL